MEGCYGVLNDMMSEFDYDSFRGLYGSEFTDDMIAHSVQTASDFFHIDNPESIYTSPLSTGVFLNNSKSLEDDVLNIDIQQLKSLGISSQDSLDLVMTHETTHRMLQGMEELGFSAPQEELCCDFMSGVRAGLNNIDASQLEKSLINTIGGEIHPNGNVRVNALREGIDFANSYIHDNLTSPTFDDCINHFQHSELMYYDNHYVEFGEGKLPNSCLGELHQAMSHSLNTMHYWASRMEDYANSEDIQRCAQKFMEAKQQFDEAEFQFRDTRDIHRENRYFSESEGSVYYNDNDETNFSHSKENTFKGYTKSEINRHISEAEHKKAAAESNMRHNASLMNTKGDKPHDFEKHQYESAKRERDNAIKEINKWRNEKPDKE